MSITDPVLTFSLFVAWNAYRFLTIEGGKSPSGSGTRLRIKFSPVLQTPVRSPERKLRSTED